MQLAGELLRLRQQPLGAHGGFDGVQHHTDDAARQLLEERQVRGRKAGERGQFQHCLDAAFIEHRQDDEVARPRAQQPGAYSDRIVRNVSEQQPLAIGSRLADKGYVVFAPQNPYIGKDEFRVLQRKANPLGLSLFSFIIRQHERVLDWLATLPFVDGARIGFYGLSYGGKTAMRVPAVLTKYRCSVCSGDFNEWTWKNVSVDFPGSYMFTPEYEMPEFNRKTLEVLRQPLEEGEVTISRALRNTTFPAEFILVAAMNPRPRGYRSPNPNVMAA